jgi:hypothetical protein
MKESINTRNVALGPTLTRTCPAVLYNLSTLSTYAHAILLSSFVTIENKRLGDRTPKPKVARGNRRTTIFHESHTIDADFKKSKKGTRLSDNQDRIDNRCWFCGARGVGVFSLKLLLLRDDPVTITLYIFNSPKHSVAVSGRT